MTTFPTLDPSKLHQMYVVISAHMSNPNGDPEAQNAPRTNPFNNHGIISAASLKRKARDYVQDKLGEEDGFRLLIRHGDVIASQVYGALRDAGVQVGEVTPFTDDERGELHDAGEVLPPNFEVSDDGVTYDRALQTKALTKLWGDLREAGVSEGTIQKLQDLAVHKKGDKKPVNKDDVKAKAPEIMTRRFWDARVFGYTVPGSAGKLRGPVQIADAISIAPVNLIDQAVTRVARGTTSESDGHSDFGRRWIVDHAVYVGHVFVNPTLSAHHGVTTEDLTLLLEGLYHGQDLARSSARPDVRVQAIVVLTHESKYGNVPFHELSKRLKVKHDGEYSVDVSFDDSGLNGVTVATLR